MDVVTTSHRGVFAGETREKDGYLVITNARMCLYWSRETRGVTGLAGIGPQPGSRISAAIPELKIPISQVTSIMRCTDVAKLMWEIEPWD